MRDDERMKEWKRVIKNEGERDRGREGGTCVCR